ncbi:MAG: aminopeptidase [Clostridiales bacterium]|nr:MAG: aminopeptidase [Clostridiales bacterium]
MLTEIIKKLNEFISPSGNEKSLLEYVKSEVESFADECYFDVMGNLVATVGNGEKVMVAAHADTIGFICHYIDDKGFIRFQDLGWENYRIIAGRHVRFINGVDGIISYEEKTKDKDSLKCDNCFIDIGATSKEEAEKLVPIGTAASIVPDCFVSANKKRLTSAFLDDRIAVAILIRAIKELDKNKLKNKVYFVFTVQEEVGTRGALPAAYEIEPKYALAIDVTDTGDTPECPKLSLALGQGAAVKIMDCGIYCHKQMVDFLIDTAEKNKIKFQPEIITAGATDARAIHTSKNGVYTGAISIPQRYVHSPVETVDLDDCENTLRLLTVSLEQGFNF